MISFGPYLKGTQVTDSIRKLNSFIGSSNQTVHTDIKIVGLLK